MRSRFRSMKSRADTPSHDEITPSKVHRPLPGQDALSRQHTSADKFRGGLREDTGASCRSALAKLRSIRYGESASSEAERNPRHTNSLGAILEIGLVRPWHVGVFSRIPLAVFSTNPFLPTGGIRTYVKVAVHVVVKTP